MSAFNLQAILSSLQLPRENFQIALAVSVATLIFSEVVGFYHGSALFKLTSSLVFVAAGIAGVTPLGSISALIEPENRGSTCIVAGLILSAIGDVLLIPSQGAYRQPPGSQPQVAQSKSPRFKLGVLFFALAHISYTASFLTSVDSSTLSLSFNATNSSFRSADFLMTIVFGYLAVDWLGILEKERGHSSWFEVPTELHGLVGGYLVVIFAMVATAAATDKGLQKITGAWLFALSDLFVAGSMFGVEDMDVAKQDVKKSTAEWKNTAIGWVLYYTAQLILAGCVQ